MTAVDYTGLAIDDLVSVSLHPDETREKARRYVAEGKCFCCGGEALQPDDPIQRCYICAGRGHGDDILPPELA